MLGTNTKQENTKRKYNQTFAFPRYFPDAIFLARNLQKRFNQYLVNVGVIDTRKDLGKYMSKGTNRSVDLDVADQAIYLGCV